jgi:hypothetical protein
VRSSYLTVTALLLGGCCRCDRPLADKAPTEPPTRARPEPSTEASHAGSANPEEGTRSWLDAAKRGDTAAMSALYADEIPLDRRFAPAAWRSVSWGDLHRAQTGPGKPTGISVHVVFVGADGIEHPENFQFDFVQRDGRWWMVSVSHID